MSEKAFTKIRKGLEDALEFARDRVVWNEDDTLDEIVSSRGAHLEHMQGNEWFLIFYHEDGTETALWFKSKELRRPHNETRSPRPSPPKD